jgi:hypothetical protein
VHVPEIEPEKQDPEGTIRLGSGFSRKWQRSEDCFSIWREFIDKSSSENSSGFGLILSRTRELTDG